MSEERFAALKAAGKHSLDFWGLDQPKCPHCGHDCNVSDNEWWHLCEEGEHEVTCPACDEDFTVSTRVSYTFSTDEQEED